MTLSASRPLARLTLLAFGALASFVPVSAHPGHGDAHAEPWYNRPTEGAPAAPAEAAGPATVEGKTLRSAETARAVEDSPERRDGSNAAPEANAEPHGESRTGR